MARTVLVLASLLAAAALAAARQKPKPPALDPDLKDVLKLTNAARAAKKLPPLALDDTLNAVAADYSKLMAGKDKMAHQLDGKKVGQRVFAAGYDYKTVAENLASAVGKKADPPPKMADLVQNWMDSPDHARNILNEKHTVIGLGVARGKDGDYYYTQILASPRKK